MLLKTTADMDNKTVKAPQGLSTSESTYRKTTTPIYKNTDQKSYTFYRYAVLDAII